MRLRKGGKGQQRRKRRKRHKKEKKRTEKGCERDANAVLKERREKKSTWFCVAIISTCAGHSFAATSFLDEYLYERFDLSI
jgi:hypothetical protein